MKIMSGPRFRNGVLLTLMLLGTPLSAFAYLDPSTGSMIISAIVGIFASIALAVKTYWYKLKGLFRRSDKPTPEASRESPSDR